MSVMILTYSHNDRHQYFNMLYKSKLIITVIINRLKFKYQESLRKSYKPNNFQLNLAYHRHTLRYQQTIGIQSQPNNHLKQNRKFNNFQQDLSTIYKQ